MSWLLSSFINRAAPPYQAAVGVIVHAMTSGLFALTTWVQTGGLFVAAVTLCLIPTPGLARAS